MAQDIKAVGKEFKINISNGTVKKVEAELEASEEVLFVSSTNVTVSTLASRKKETIHGIVVLTNKRMFYIYNIMLNSAKESVPLDEIRSISYSGALVGYLEIITLSKSYDILISSDKKLSDKILKTFENARKNYIEEQSAQENSNGQQKNDLDQLEQLANLKDRGIITQEEFDAKKKQILGI